MLRNKLIGFAMLMVLVAVSGAFAVSDDALGVQPEKRLFDTRWYQTAEEGYGSYMTLSTSQVYYVCGLSEEDCESRWSGPTEAAIADWNAQNTTVEIAMQPDQSDYYDLNVMVGDVILEDPAILGLALQFDEQGEFCFEDCTVWFGHVYAADFLGNFLVPEYGTPEAHQATLVHEIGHELALGHESIDADDYPSYPCEDDITGPIPVSIMSYNCIDPVEFGGRGFFEVQPWDVCGVNHAYEDPGIGFAGCEGYSAPTTTPEASPPPGPTQSPTPTPSTGGGTTVAWANADCDEELSTRDNQAILRVVLSQNNLSQTQPCNPIGSMVTVDGYGELMWSDADCDGEITTRDNQAVMRKVLSQAALSQTAPCPAVGTDVAVNSE